MTCTSMRRQDRRILRRATRVLSLNAISSFSIPLNIAPTNAPLNSARQDGLVLSLPITINDVEKELNMFEGDEPMDVISVFCEDNMPDEGTACVDQLLLVVQGKLAT